MEINLIRHFQTPGNKKGQYIGSTDESILPVSDHGKEYPEVDFLITSPMKRCIETAKIIYPKKKLIQCKDLRERDFGRFEGKTYLDLRDDFEYQRWLDLNGKAPFPAGEPTEDFCTRTIHGFRDTINKFPEDARIALVIHGGNIMAIMCDFAGGDFYDWQVKNGNGYHIHMGKDFIITRIEKI
ncbi:alpha-ribazole phosphatase [Aequitasia blattaphilus]|uniref:Histidine phosphatase family protein n=1 Tax=Aequitasia blattaphilus TaxID=2949332 RepID=A0ABT1EB59_9FIRM|nr:histidine phosphatase family protein [Aequitasia blattaphilus]MCP1102167.1 histidine phosphatase family protein [Aequitasia blattaphilus]MCR8614807.1 histidine phosphatase family protein [Aequitasia blattaphilus]